MNNFIIDTPDNFWQIRWLDKYMEGHKGFIAGGCFKNILSGERVKDIDIFFESESDFQEAIDSFNDEKHQKEGWKFKYRNEKVCAFQKEGEKVWIEFIESEFGKIDEKNKNPELTSINTFNDTVKKANEIKDRVLKCVYNIKQERSYNNDLVGIFERYKDIADGDMEVAMNFIKEAYPFNEETESFIRKKFDMPIPDESKEQ